MVLTATGEVHTHKEAQVFVHALNQVTVQLLKETAAVLPLGKLCEDHGYSCEWVRGQKPRPKKFLCKTENFVPLVVPGLSSNSGTSSSSIRKLERGQDPKLQYNRDSDDRQRDLPKWLKEFTDNLEDTGMPVPAHISRDSDSERPTKVTSKKQSIYTRFPKGPKLRSMHANQDDKGSLQKAKWRSSTSSRKVW